MSEIVGKSARELRELIGTKAISPVEVFDAFVGRIEKVNPAINAIVAMDLDRSREEARRAEQAIARKESLGKLHGLPIGINDLQSTAGLTTTFGSLPHKDNVPKSDDLLVARIRKQGGIVLGKTNTPEFGTGANTINRVYGATVNPFAPTLSASGSSGGAAAALATDMVPLATGGDLGGSLRTPAAFCGVVGHRTAPGTLPKDRAADSWSPLAVEGAMARNVADAAFLTGALMGPEPLDPIYREQPAAPFFSLPARDLSQMRVAFTTDFGTIPVADDVRECFQSAAAKIARFFKSADWRHPECGDVDSTFEALRAVGFAHAFGDHLRQHRSVASPLLIANMETAEALTVADVGRAHAAQSNLFRKFQAFFNDVDVLICPTAPVMPFPVDELYVRKIGNVEMASYIRWIALNYTITLSTHPTTAIPAGVGPGGLPFGIQVVGRHLDDVGTLATAAALESEFSKDPKLARPKPDIQKLSTPGLETRAGQIPSGLIGGR